MNILHDVDPARITPEDFLAVIEIVKGSKKKYELDKETGLLVMDRLLYTSTHYPSNYGFIPRTLSDDGDPLDVLVLCSEPIDPMVLVRCYPVGVITMLDDGAKDEKIIAIPFGDPTFNPYRTIEAIPSHIFTEMQHFFRVYKELEHKQTAVNEVEGRAAAIRVIEDSLMRYNKKHTKKRAEKKYKSKIESTTKADSGGQGTA